MAIQLCWITDYKLNFGKLSLSDLPEAWRHLPPHETWLRQNLITPSDAHLSEKRRKDQNRYYAQYILCCKVKILFHILVYARAYSTLSNTASWSTLNRSAMSFNLSGRLVLQLLRLSLLNMFSMVNLAHKMWNGYKVFSESIKMTFPPVYPYSPGSWAVT